MTRELLHIARFRVWTTTVALAVATTACQGKDARSAGSDSLHAVTSAPSTAAASAAPSGTATSSAEPASSSAMAAPSASPPQAEPADAGSDVNPVLLAPDGGVLPQTEERPAASSPWLDRSARLLFRAIVEDRPELAHPVFFPIVAYRRVKAVSDPDRDYERRLLAHFDRDIHEYHRHLGAQASQTSFVALDVPEAQARWMKPHSEGNRLGYFRVLRSRLRYKDAAGKERALEVTSLISWRGQWYVVHLNGFE